MYTPVRKLICGILSQVFVEVCSPAALLHVARGLRWRSGYVLFDVARVDGGGSPLMVFRLWLSWQDFQVGAGMASNNRVQSVTTQTHTSAE